MCEKENVEHKKQVIKWVDFLKNYEICYSDGMIEKPIVIMAPDGSNPNHLRVYAFGGDIGRIPLNPDCDFELSKDRGYAKYIGTTQKPYINGHGQKFYPPSWLANYISKQIIETEEVSDAEGLLDKYLSVECIDEKRKLLVGDKAKYYLPLILAAQKNRWINKNGSASERNVQHQIAKTFLEKNGIKGDKPLLIMDMEFDMPLTKERQEAKAKSKELRGEAKKSKPDFVVFDGKSFGFVELKCTKSGFNCNNNLDIHFDDFYDLIYDASDKIRWEQYGVCLGRLNIMLQYHIIGDAIRGEWKKAYKKQSDYYAEHQNGKFEESLFWCGFMFIRRADLTKQMIKDRINNNLLLPCKDKIEGMKQKNAQVFCDYFEDGEIQFDMTGTIQTVMDKLKNSSD